jgi:hypothetical protein
MLPNVASCLGCWLGYITGILVTIILAAGRLLSAISSSVWVLKLTCAASANFPVLVQNCTPA